MVKKDANAGIHIIARDIVPRDQIKILSDPEPAIEVFHHVTDEDLFDPGNFEPFVQIMDTTVNEVLADGQIDFVKSPFFHTSILRSGFGCNSQATF